jgi:hypothetical protein
MAILIAGGIVAWINKDKILAAVQSGDVSKLTPGGGNKTIDSAAYDEEAQKKLNELERTAGADAGFLGIEGVLNQFDDYRRQYRGTPWDLAAANKRKAYLERADVVAQGELRAIREQEQKLLSAGKDREVHQLYSRFPVRFLETTETGRIVKEELKSLSGRITEKFVKDKAALHERVRERKYDDALALLASMEEYALPDQLIELGERKRALEGLRKVGESSASAVEARDKYLMLDGRLRAAFSARNYRDVIAALTGFLYGAWPDNEKAFVRAEGVDYEELKKELDAKPPAYEKALARIEKGMGDPANLAEATTAQSILLDLRNGISLELFKAAVNEGIDRTARATTTREYWTLASFGAKRGHFEKRDQKIFWVSEGGKPAEIDPWVRIAAEADLVALAARSWAPDRAGAEAAAEKDPVFHLRAGLLHNFSRTGTTGAAHAARHFRIAAEKGVKGVTVYLSDLTVALQKLAEQEAGARFAEAKGLLAQGQAGTARTILEELSAMTKVKFVDEHRAEIEKMLQEIAAQLSKGKKFEEAYRAKVEAIDDKRIRVFYDFTDKAQGEMFEQVTLDGKLKGRWKSNGGVLEAQSGTSVSSASKWRPEIKGDVEVEYDLVALEDPQNIATDLFYQPGTSRYYAVTFGVDFAVGNMEEMMQIPNTAVIKYPIDFQAARAKLPAEWEKVKARLVGAPVTEFRLKKKDKVKVKIVRVAKKITLLVDGKAVWDGEDVEYTSGYLLFFSDCRAQIDNLAITFTP